MADSDDPFKRPDATVLRPRPGAGRRRASSEPAAAAAPAVGDAGADASPLPTRALIWHRAQSAGAGGEPAAAAGRPAARVASRRWTSPACAAMRSTRSAGSRSRRARPRVAERNRAGRALRAVRRARRSGAVHAVGRAERMGAASAARRAASRGVGRREVLRDARPDLAAIPAATST